MIKEIFLLRGAPGAGKSTLAKKFEGARHFEADMFFMDENGNYNFDVTKLRQAHEWCRNNVANTMSVGSDIVVSNTFTQEWEMEAYYKLAEQYGYRVYSLVVENRHEGVNEHGVPADKLEQMKNRFEIKL